MESFGFLAALGAALAWGSYIVPFKKSKSERLIQFQTLMGAGILTSGFAASLVLGYPLNLNIYGLISGALWAIANAISLIAFLNLGISKAIPSIISLVILSSFLWGALVFGEIPNMALGFFAISLIIAGVALVSTTSDIISTNTKKGFIAAILSGLIFGGQLVPLKIGNVTPGDFFFSSCLGIAAVALLIAFLTKTKFKKEAIWESFFSGTIWNIGNLLSVVSISIIGLAKGQTLSLSAVLVGVLWGIFYFKEITQRKKKIQVLLGAAVLLIGVVVLSIA